MISLVNLTKQKVRKHNGVVRICWNEFLSEANNNKSDKQWGWVKLCWNDFLSKSNKTKKRENIWELSNYVGKNFFAKQTTKM